MNVALHHPFSEAVEAFARDLARRLGEASCEPADGTAAMAGLLA